MKKTLISGALIIGLQATFFGTELYDQVFGNPVRGIQAMQPGEWREITNAGGLTWDLLRANEDLSIIAWSNKGAWDSTHNEFHFVGQGHHGWQKYIRYSELTNTWTIDANCCFEIDNFEIGHGYEHNTVNPQTGNQYYRMYNSNTIKKRVFGNTAASDFSNFIPLPLVTGNPSTQVGSTIEYFPEKGGLIYMDSVAGVWFFNESSDQWSPLATGGSGGQIGIGPYHAFSAYNPTHKTIIFGSGNGNINVYKIDVSGNVSQIKNLPVEMGPSHGMVFADPASGASASGRYVAFHDNGRMYEYDVQTNSDWRDIGTHPLMNYVGQEQWRIGAPIWNKGVILFLTDSGKLKKPRMWLYKYSSTGSPPSPDTTSPAAPKNLRVK